MGPEETSLRDPQFTFISRNFIFRSEVVWRVPIHRLSVTRSCKTSFAQVPVYLKREQLERVGSFREKLP